MEASMAEDTRYPYTYACDFIRAIAGYNKGGTKLSRADASQIRTEIAKVLRIPDEKVARKLADYYLAHKEEITEKSARELVSMLIPNIEGLRP
jgi:hypothetical protein